MTDNLVITRSGRKVEVREYGDASGHPVVFFHGLIGSHHQASYVGDQASKQGLRIIAPNRPGVGASEFVVAQLPSMPSPTWKISPRRLRLTRSA